MMGQQRACIEALTAAIPRRVLSLDDLAARRGVDPAKFAVGLGAREMAVADPGEDTVALAATAGARLLRAYDVDPASIGMLVVGTETGVDHAKPVASFVQGLLGLPRAMRTFDAHHACYGGTAGLMAASDWIVSGSAAGRSALVVCSDVARYGVETAGEPTQGAGAVAMLVSACSAERAHLLALDQGITGTFSTDVHDFWRPVGRREALVDGHYSIRCYLDAVAGAYRGWRERALARELVRDTPVPSPSQQLARIAYHVPFCKMAKKAHAQVCAADQSDDDGPRDADAMARAERVFAARFASQVSSTLALPSRIGNTYTASLYLSLASMLYTEGATLGGQRVGLFSYGSGCSSEFFSGVVGERAASVMATAQLDAMLDARVRIDAAEYERIMQLPPDSPQNDAPTPGAFLFAGVVEGRRTYARG
jgi:hydroxymethylglutaryl-CoA synthase